MTQAVFKTTSKRTETADFGRRRVQFIDLEVQQGRIRKTIEDNIKAVLDHGRYIMGPEIKTLEDRLRTYVGVKHAIGCASGTDALLMAVMAQGVGPGDAVFTSPFTFIATAEIISLLGAVPVFVDIDPDTFNIDPEKLEKAVQSAEDNDPSIYPVPALKSRGKKQPAALKPRGIIAVDIFGLPADYENIQRIAQEHGLFVIEDAAQSFGAQIDDRKAGSYGDTACTSFFPAKPLGCYGDGGMCFTDNDKLAEIMQSLRVHGKGQDKYDNVRIGINGRLDTLQAGILLAKFEIFPEEIELRGQVAHRYSELFGLLPDFQIQAIPRNCKSAWAQYSLLAADSRMRANLQNQLKEAGIPTAVYYPKPLHLQTAFSYLGYQPDDFPVSENYASRIFSLPMHPYLTEEEQERIVEVIGNR
jgi:dTDP-4-amino-4,6-dideoxygalactose transaminase